MKKFYLLGTCSTCQRIQKELSLPGDVEIREIKSEPLTEMEVDRLAAKTGSYEALFSKRAQKYRELDLHEISLTEQDYRKYLLVHYTFLKRPLLETETKVVAGNSKQAVREMGEVMSAGL